MKLFILILICIDLVFAMVQSPSLTYNVTLPEPNGLYVAGQMLPISYTLPDNADLPKLLSLSISFITEDPRLNFTGAVVTNNADISQGFSFRRTHNTFVYYEHQLSYSIPKNAVPGNYIVLFNDAVSKTNTSIPIIVRPYAPQITPSSTSVINSRPSGGSSIFAVHSNDSSRKYSSANRKAALLLGVMFVVYNGLLL
ncbi:uncharacterized protein BX663DRAFT_583967 [Cokeromyces recurvatus]|uniref:uncharacterized protein n=1 Tax=Cokeromyces recurvatus TaxID=90255 RepID=UPI0022208884|nr:uncharacterized protein BX663DRAFT_583967 [Cokeromyces recurvatus]KAI7905719.1 hypothetical protein BX663DRAFT_583967 [Cokeromyces recurvatus]